MIFRFINHTLVSHLMQWWKLSKWQGHNIFSIDFFYTILKRKFHQHITIFYILYRLYYLQALSILKKENKQVRFIWWHCGVLKMFFSKWWEQVLNQCSLKDLGVCEGAGPIVVGPSASPFMDWPFSYYCLRRSNNIQSITL